MTDQVLAELKKLNEKLERIDWKFWMLYQKFIDDKVQVPSQPAESISNPVVATQEEQKDEYEYDLDIKPVTKTLVPVEPEVEKTTVEPVANNLTIPKYPTVEKL